MIMNHIFFAMLTSTVTSTMLLLLWHLLRGVFMAVNPKMIYTTLRWICITYFLPIGYAAAVLTYRVWIQGNEQVWKLAFSGTEEILRQLRVVSAGWFVLVCVLLAYRCADNNIWRRKLLDSIPETDRMVQKTFRRVCRNLGIPKGTLSVSRNVLVCSPMVAGIRDPQVLLPEKDYTQEDLEAIFYHELSHYKHGDLKFKMLVVLIMLVHCINPFTYVLLYIVNFWSECMADASALEASGKLHHAKDYFARIVSFLPKDREAMREKYLFSALYNDNRILAKRVAFMKKYQNAHVAGRAVTSVFAALFILCSTALVFVSGKLVADMHSSIYQKTEDRQNETVVAADDGMLEHYCREEDLAAERTASASASDEAVMSLKPGVVHEFSWTIQPDTRYVSDAYQVEAGQHIYISVTVHPASGDYLFGIINESGSVCYIEKEEIATVHQFTIVENGSCRIFVQNNSKEEIVLYTNGSYQYAD